MKRREKKSVQALNYFAANCPDGMNRLKLIKLLWLADKYHLLKYGRTILKDHYCALPHGPAASETLAISKSVNDPYVKEYLNNGKHFVKSIKSPDTTLFSESDLEILDLVWGEFGRMSSWNLRDLTHAYPEWKKFEEDLNDQLTSKSYNMDLEDFYKIPEADEKNRADFFHSIPRRMIEESIETYKLRKRFEAL